MKKMKRKFKNWKYPLFEESKVNEYNWLVQNIDGLELGELTDIGAFTYINAKFGVKIKDNVQIGSHCSIYSVSTIDDKSGVVVLHENCKIGSHSTILPNISVGKNSIIGAHSLVNKSVPDNMIAYGSPIRIIRKIDEE